MSGNLILAEQWDVCAPTLLPAQNPWVGSLSVCPELCVTEIHEFYVFRH